MQSTFHGKVTLTIMARGSGSIEAERVSCLRLGEGARSIDLSLHFHTALAALHD